MRGNFRREQENEKRQKVTEILITIFFCLLLLMTNNAYAGGTHVVRADIGQSVPLS